MKKFLFISSCGGHLSELMQLNELFKKYDYEADSASISSFNFNFWRFRLEIAVSSGNGRAISFAISSSKAACFAFKACKWADSSFMRYLHKIEFK